MNGNQVKEFRMEGEKLIIEVKAKDKLLIPGKEKQEEIGVYEQTTIQTVDKDKIQVLHNFIKEQKKQGDTQIEAVTKQLEPLKDIIEIDPKVAAECKKFIGKGTKQYKQKMTALNDAIINLDKRTAFMQQKDFLEKQMMVVEADLEKLEKAIGVKKA